MEKNEIIRQKLVAIGENYDTIKPFLQEYLLTIEDFIQFKEHAQSEAIETLSTSTYNVSSVSKHLDCSRTTLYNHNQLLKRYIEHSAELFEKSNPYKAYNDIKESRQKLQDQVWLMENRDIDFEILKHEKSLLTNTIVENTKEIERLKLRINKLSAELQGYKRITINK